MLLLEKNIMKLNCTEDKLNRIKHLKPLTNLLSNLNDESFVMSVSAPYGGGKTFFIDLWGKHLEKKEFKILKYNAWENDIADNPFMSFIACFKGLGLDELTWKELLSSATDVITDELLSNKNILGLAVSQMIDSFGERSTPWIKKIVRNTKRTYKKIISEAQMKSLFYQQVQAEVKKKKQIEELKKTIIKIMNEKKLVIFIDDLDRCNPQYAIKFLEYIKHIFDIPNCIFVLVVDEEQLKSSIEIIYGNKNSNDFLSKIIDFKFRLPSSSTCELILHFIDTLSWEPFFKVREDKWQFSSQRKKENFIAVFDGLSKIFKLSVRDIIQICQNLNVIFKSHNPCVISPTYLVLVYIIENYKYKIQSEMEQYLSNNNNNYLTALAHYISAKNLDIPKKSDIVGFMTDSGPRNFNRCSELQDYLRMLSKPMNSDNSYKKTEAHCALSISDYEDDNYEDLYEKHKIIIQDIISFDEERDFELQKQQQRIY